MIINKIDIEKKPVIKNPKYFNGFGSLFTAPLLTFVIFPSILLMWSITSLNGLFSFFIQPPLYHILTYLSPKLPVFWGPFHHFFTFIFSGIAVQYMGSSKPSRQIPIPRKLYFSTRFSLNRRL
jgi:hypothetical protein